TATGRMERFIHFGSYITAKPVPQDIDVVLIMRDAFVPDGYDEETRSVFDHQQAGSRWGASLFWTTPSGLLLVGDVADFIAGWGIKRDRTQRGVVEIVP